MDWDPTPKVVGVFPQSEGPDDKYYKPKCVDESIFVWEDKNITPFLFGLELAPDSILSDRISCSYISSNKGFVFSNRMIDLLKHYVLPKYNVVPITFVRNRSFIEGYSLLYFVNFINENIDFSRSSFLFSIIDSETSKSIDSVELQFSRYLNFDEFRKYGFRSSVKGNYLRLSQEKVFLKEKYDFFQLSLNGGRSIVSERLKEDIKKQKYTGMSFNNIDWICS